MKISSRKSHSKAICEGRLPNHDLVSEHCKLGVLPGYSFVFSVKSSLKWDKRNSKVRMLCNGRKPVLIDSITHVRLGYSKAPTVNSVVLEELKQRTTPLCACYGCSTTDSSNHSKLDKVSILTFLNNQPLEFGASGLNEFVPTHISTPLVLAYHFQENIRTYFFILA
jgi:hypothetical protein